MPVSIGAFCSSMLAVTPQELFLDFEVVKKGQLYSFKVQKRVLEDLVIRGGRLFI